METVLVPSLGTDRTASGGRSRDWTGGNRSERSPNAMDPETIGEIRRHLREVRPAAPAVEDGAAALLRREIDRVLAALETDAVRERTASDASARLEEERRSLAEAERSRIRSRLVVYLLVAAYLAILAGLVGWFEHAAGG